MKNCLKTQLKGTVNNSSLRILGAIKASWSSIGNQNMNIEVKTGETVEVVDSEGGAITHNGGTVSSLIFDSTHTSYYGVSFPSNKLIIKNKYAIKKLNSNHICGFDLEELSVCDELYFINIANGNSMTGDLKALEDLPLTELSLYNTTGISGSLSSLSMPSLVVTNLFAESEGNISGSIEGFVSAQIANGRTSVAYADAIKLNVYRQKVTFGEDLFDFEPYSFITWESVSKIVIYAGNSSIGSCPKVYAKGATQTEISEWEDAGKTVIVVD